MGKKRWWGGMLGMLVLAACGNGVKKTTAETEKEMEQARMVMDYYDTSMSLLKDLAVEKDINAVLKYMELNGKAPNLRTIAPPAVSPKDSAFVMNPGNYFDRAAQQELRQNYRGLFQTRQRFYDLFNRYLTLSQSGDQSRADKMLEIDFQLSTEMDEYKENIMDILAPFTDDAETVLRGSRQTAL